MDSSFIKGQGEGVRDGGGPANPSGASVDVGVVVIDIQNSFVETATRRNPGSNLPARLANARQVFRLAGAHTTPFFVTYEASKTGRGALPTSLAGDLPQGAHEFIKTTFAATGQPQFAQAINASGLRRFLVMGAETDVCVMQTILGMRRAGFDIAALVDAIFTEEVNVGPALRRLRQAGVVTVDMRQAEALLSGDGSVLEAAPESKPVIVSPLELGLVLNRADALGAADANANAKRVRLRELLLISEWFRLPIFAADPAAATAALPADLRSILTRGILPLASRPANVKQLAVFGGHAGARESAASLRQGGTDVFLVTDALIGGTHASLEPAYAEGAVPTTYKSLYYELTRSVSDAEWPSSQWVTDGDRYFDRTQAPEDLPPIGESQ